MQLNLTHFFNLIKHNRTEMSNKNEIHELLIQKMKFAYFAFKTETSDQRTNEQPKAYHKASKTICIQLSPCFPSESACTLIFIFTLIFFFVFFFIFLRY